MYINNILKPSNIKLISRYYKINEDKIKTNLSNTRISKPTYKASKTKFVESHLYGNISQRSFFTKLENVLAHQDKAFKVNIQLGYKLIDERFEEPFDYEYRPQSNTSIFDQPIAINSRKDIRSKVIDHIKSKDFTTKISTPRSGVKLQEINAFKIMIYYRNHSLGDSEVVVPKAITDNRHILNFPKTENKCMFHCIAYHLQDEPKKDYRRITAAVKHRFKQYCEFKKINYSVDTYKAFKPIDIYQFDDFEECFKVNIDVFEMDIETSEVSKIRASEKNSRQLLTLWITTDTQCILLILIKLWPNMFAQNVKWFLDVLLN